MQTHNNYKLRKGSTHWVFDKSRNKIQFFGGGFANGKTTALVIKALKLCVAYPGSNGLLGRSTYPKLNDTLRKVFFQWCPPDWIKKMPTQDDNTCYLKNGTVINFRYISQRGKQNVDGSTTSNLLSATYDWIGIDQIEDPEIVHKDLLDLMGRLRGQTPYRPDADEDETLPDSGPRWLMLTCNPTSNWVYRELVRPLQVWQKTGRRTEQLLLDPQTNSPIIDLVEGSTYTNAENLTPDFLRSLEASYRGQMRARFLEGKWAAYEGLVYQDFDETKHLISREYAMKHLWNLQKAHYRVKAIEGFDFGISSPSCYLFGFMDDWGRVVIMDGYYKRNFHYTGQPSEVIKIRNKYAHLIDVEDYIHADPSIFKQKVIEKHIDTGTPIAHLLSASGMECRPATNDITTGVAKVAAYLADQPTHEHIVTGRTPGPLLYFVDDLDFISDEITNYYWDRTSTGEHVDRPIDRDDHAMDAIKYMLSHLSEPAEIITPKDKKPKPWMFWQEEGDDGKYRRARG
jgi:Terminase large subunit, T4likevirus-type, N-terminal